MPKPVDARRTLRFTPATAKMVKPGPGVVVRPALSQVTTKAPVATRTVLKPARPTTGPSKSQARAVPRDGVFGWIGAHKVLTTVVALLVATASVGIAAVVFGQSFTATPTTRTSPVAFAAGDDVTDLDLLDFIDAPVIGASGATASITLYGIPGASSLSLGEVLELRNADTADNQDYAVTLTVSGTPAATLLDFVIEFDDAGSPVSWDLLADPSIGPLTLADGETWEFDVVSLLMTALASGSQGVLTISASMTPV